MNDFGKWKLAISKECSSIRIFLMLLVMVENETDDVWSHAHVSGVFIADWLIGVFDKFQKLLIFVKFQHNVEHNELWWMNNGYFVEMFMQYLSRVHPPEIDKLMITMHYVVQFMQIFLMLGISQKINIFVVLDRQSVESCIIAGFNLRNCYQTNERQQI